MIYPDIFLMDKDSKDPITFSRPTKPLSALLQYDENQILASYVK